MPDFPKFDELFRVGRNYAVGRSNRLTLTAVDRDGTDSNVLVATGAAMVEEGVGAMASVQEGLWLDSAFRTKLDRLAWDRYGMRRKPAGPAFVTLSFTTTTAAPAAFALPVGTIVKSADGREFSTVTSSAFPTGSIGPVQVTARSSLAGVDQNVGPDKLKSLVSQISGAAADLAVNNTEAATGGAGAESDEAFKSRIRAFFISARRGTLGAIESGALAIPGVVRAVAFEGLVGPGYPNRMVSLVIADEFTDALVKQGVGVPAYETKSRAFAKVVELGLGEYRAGGMPVHVSVAQVFMVPIVLRLRYQAAGTIDTEYLSLLARAQAVTTCNELDPGATLDPAAIVARLRALPGLDVQGDEVVSPSGPVVPLSPYQRLCSSMSIVTVDNQALTSSIQPVFG